MLAYQPGSSTNLLAGSDGGIYVSNNAANAPQGPPTGVINPPVFKDTNLTMNTIEFYGGDISSNFATSNAPFIVAGAQDNGSSYGQFGPGATCPTPAASGRSGSAATASTRGSSPSRDSGCSWRARTARSQRSTTARRPVPGRRRRLGGRPPLVRLPVQDRQVRVPDDDVRPHDRRVVPGLRVDRRRLDSWSVNSPDLTKGNLGDRSYINQLDYAPETNGNAIVGTNDGNVQYGFGLGTGTANTATWVNVTGANKVLPNRPIQDVAISPQNALVGYAAAGGFNENTSKTPGHVFRLTCTTFCNTYTWANKSGTCRTSR